MRAPDGSVRPVDWIDTVDEAREKGRLATLDHLRVPPYPEDSEQYAAWVEGLAQALRERP